MNGNREQEIDHLRKAAGQKETNGDVWRSNRDIISADKAQVTVTAVSFSSVSSKLSVLILKIFMLLLPFIKV